MDADLATLASALYVRIDDMLKKFPEQAPRRPVIGIATELSDAELLAVAVMQALLGFVSESRWLRYARKPATSRSYREDEGGPGHGHQCRPNRGSPGH